MSLGCDISLTMRARHSVSLDGGVAPTVENLSYSFAQTLADGLLADQANIRFHDQVTLTDTNSNDYDLFGGTMLDPERRALAFTKVKLFFIRQVSGPVGTGFDWTPIAGSNPWIGLYSGALTSHPGERCGGSSNAFVLSYSPSVGFTVNSGSRNFRVRNNTGGTVVYDIIIIGTGTAT